MAYCTAEDLLSLLSQTELIQLSADTGNNPDDEVIEDAIEAAQAEIDSYLAVRYSLPLAQVPPRVKHLTIDLAIYNLFSRRSLLNEVRRQRYLDAIEFLRQVAAGEATLGLADANLPDSQGSGVEVSANQQIFSWRSLSNY